LKSSVTQLRASKESRDHFTNIPSSRKGLYLTRRGEISFRAVDEHADNNEEMREKNDIVVSSVIVRFVILLFCLARL
jgi:hypothetical protein